MKKYYTRACNFAYGKFSIKLVRKKKKLPKPLKEKINKDLKSIVKKNKNFSSLNFNKIPNIMGILNLTPDSFSDGGKFNKKKKGISHAKNLFKSGADIIDVGGESTRPGSKTVSKKEEWNRIKEILKDVNKKIPLSLDTRKSEIMIKGIQLGVKLINDVSGLSYDPKTVEVLIKNKTPFVIQHSQGTPEKMQKNPKYKNELLDIYDFFEQKIKFLRSMDLKHNMNLIRSISIFHTLGFPILLGLSRKKFIKDLSGKNDSKERLGGTVASSMYAIMQGVQILRIHDVNELRQSIKVFKELIKN